MASAPDKPGILARIASVYWGMTVRAFWIWVGIFLGALLAQMPKIALSLVGLAVAVGGRG